MSRPWWIGPGAPRPVMVDAMRHAREPLKRNMRLLRPGVRIPELSAACNPLRPAFQARKHGSMMHGVGLCDEWPLVAYPDHAAPGAVDHPLEPGMVLRVEALVSSEGGLPDQAGESGPRHGGRARDPLAPPVRRGAHGNGLRRGGDRGRRAGGAQRGALPRGPAFGPRPAGGASSASGERRRVAAPARGAAPGRAASAPPRGTRRSALCRAGVSVPARAPPRWPMNG